MVQLNKEANLELRKAVTSFNRQIKRLENKGISPSLIPSRVSVRELKNAYSNEKELQKRLSLMSKLTSAGEVYQTKTGVNATDALFEFRNNQKKEMIKKYNSEIQKLKKTPMRYRGRKQMAIQNLQAKIGILKSSSRRKTAQELNRELKNFALPEKLLRQNRGYRDVYFRTLDEIANVSEENRSKIKALKSKLSEIPDAEFYDTVNNNPEFDDIKFLLLDSPNGKTDPSSIKFEENLHMTEDELSESLDDMLKTIDIINSQNL